MKKIILLSVIAVLTFVSCKKKVNGCTDSTATNYNVEATDDDGSCTYPEPVPIIAYSIEFVAYQASGYNTDLNVYDGSILIGNLQNYTTTLFNDDVYNVTVSQSGLGYALELGQGENIQVRNQAGDTLVIFGGNLTNVNGSLDISGGWSHGGSTTMRAQPIENETILLFSIESSL